MESNITCSLERDPAPTRGGDFPCNSASVIVTVLLLPFFGRFLPAFRSAFASCGGMDSHPVFVNDLAAVVAGLRDRERCCHGCQRGGGTSRSRRDGLAEKRSRSNRENGRDDPGIPGAPPPFLVLI